MKHSKANGEDISFSPEKALAKIQRIMWNRYATRADQLQKRPIAVCISQYYFLVMAGESTTWLWSNTGQEPASQLVSYGARTEENCVWVGFLGEKCMEIRKTCILATA